MTPFNYLFVFICIFAMGHFVRIYCQAHLTLFLMGYGTGAIPSNFLSNITLR